MGTLMKLQCFSEELFAVTMAMVQRGIQNAAGPDSATSNCSEAASLREPPPPSHAITRYASIDAYCPYTLLLIVPHNPGHVHTCHCSLAGIAAMSPPHPHAMLICATLLGPALHASQCQPAELADTPNSVPPTIPMRCSAVFPMPLVCYFGEPTGGRNIATSPLDVIRDTLSPVPSLVCLGCPLVTPGSRLTPRACCFAPSLPSPPFVIHAAPSLEQHSH